MKKFLIFCFICILILIILISFYFYKNEATRSYENNSSNINFENNKESYKFTYFNPLNSNSDFYYGNNMEFMNSIYYKVITNYSEYLIYKDNYNEIYDMKNEDFENYFLVLTITENESTKNLTLESIETDDTTLYIGLNKMDNIEDLNDVRGISIKIDKSLLRENVEVFKTINNTNFMTSYTNIKELPKDYKIEDAINDNCFVISTDPATNIEVLNNYLNKIQNNQDAEARVVNYNELSDSIIIFDLKYISNEKEYYVCVDNSRNNKINETYNYYEFDSFKKIEETSNIKFSENVDGYKFENSKYPENSIGFNFKK